VTLQCVLLVGEQWYKKKEYRFAVKVSTCNKPPSIKLTTFHAYAAVYAGVQPVFTVGKGRCMCGAALLSAHCVLWPDV
jgi:hypothetical protein